MVSRFQGFTARILVSGLLGLALVSGAASSALARHASPSANARDIHTPKTGGPIQGAFRSGVVNLATLPPATATASSGAPTPGATSADLPVKTPAQQAAYRQWVMAHPGLLPKATSGLKSASSANIYGNGVNPVLVSKGAGLSSADVAAAHGGAYTYPPDQALAVSPGYIFEGVNNLMVVYTWTYAKKYGPWTPDQVFASVKHANAVFRDPQITYDAERNAYIIVWLEIAPKAGTNTLGYDYLDIAISKTSTPSPLTNFRVYQYPATTFGADAFCDYPTLGYDYWGIYVTCSSYAVSTGAWVGNNTAGLSINKLRDGTGPRGWWWTSIYSDVSCGASCYYPLIRVSPTIEDGVPQAEWITGVDAGFGGTHNTQVVCAITNTVALNTASQPTLTCAVITLPQLYTDPIAVPVPGTATALDVGLGYKQVTYRNGQLYFAWTVAGGCGGSTHDFIVWAAITPQLTTKAANNPQHVNGVASAYTQSGYWCYAAFDTYMPTLIADTEGDVTLTYNLSNATTTYTGIYYAGRTAADAPGTMGQGFAARVLDGSFTNSSGRWGDYAACALSTNMVTRGVVFCANEIMSTQSGSGWDTELYQIRMQ
jgi:hypothetical protein